MHRGQLSLLAALFHPFPVQNGNVLGYIGDLLYIQTTVNVFFFHAAITGNDMGDTLRIKSAKYFRPMCQQLMR